MVPRAVRRLVRFPGVAAALVAAAAVVAISAVGGALYVDDTGDAALAQFALHSPLVTMHGRGVITDSRQGRANLSPALPGTWPLLPSDLDSSRVTSAVRGIIGPAPAADVVVQTVEEVTVDPEGGGAPEGA